MSGAESRGALQTLPRDNATYSNAQYWDKRFAEEEEYEWFRGYEAFKACVCGSGRLHVRLSDPSCARTAWLNVRCSRTNAY